MDNEPIRASNTHKPTQQKGTIMNGTQITLKGLVATTARQTDGLTIFRLVEHRDEARSNWYTIRAYGDLAENVYLSIERGDRVLVCGRIEVVDWDNGETTGTSVEIHAEAIGHDLAHHTTNASERWQ